MPLSVYFDTNIFNRIDDGEISGEEAAGLRAGLRDGRLTARLSLTNLEELVGRWDDDRNAVARKLRIARDFVGFHGVLKEADELLAESVRAYADGGAQPSPELPEGERRRMVHVFGDTANHSVRYAEQLSGIVKDVREQKEAVRASLMASYGHAEQALNPSALRRSGFENYWSGGAPAEWAGIFAARFGLREACDAHGLIGLVQVRPMRLAVLWWMSLIFTQVANARKPEIGDAYDFYPAILASTAEVSLTCDQRFAKHLSAVPTDGFRVARSVPDLLALC